MTEETLHRWLVLAIFALGILTWVSLVFVIAPYGRHARPGWGPGIPSRLGWIVMESPAVFFFCWVFARGAHRAELVPLILLGAWQFHYIHRTFIFPFRMRIRGKKMPLLIPLLAFAFNVLNAYVNARWISHLGRYDDGWLRDPRFLLGAGLFLAGWMINVNSDSLLFRLRKPGETGYRVPGGGLHEWVASPNYLGEIIEWTGFALMSWSLAALAFAFYTVANLVPRAAAHLGWNRENLPGYPRQRKALIPHVW
jgi:steroid 5-alpha-reductase/3-oxo-5-alpha-steroid 4-dehydrogenase 1